MSLDVQIRVHEYLKSRGIEFSYRQIPSGLSRDQLVRCILPNLRNPYSWDESGTPLKFQVTFRKGSTVYSTEYGQGIGFVPKVLLKGVNRDYGTLDALHTKLNRMIESDRTDSGFRFAFDFLYIADFNRNGRWMNIANEIARSRGVQAARDFLDRNGMFRGITAADVLRCLVSDSYASEVTFEEWCSEFGYETDSRKAFETYQTCDQTGKNIRFMGIPELKSILEDY